jgi:hypothetical protein
MTKQSAKADGYFLTNEHFDRERAELNKIRSEMVADQAHALQEFDRKFDRLIQLQADVAYLAERHAKPERTKPAEPEPKTGGRVRRINAGKPYTPEQDARIMASERGERAQLAHELGHPYDGLLKRHEILSKKKSKPEKTDPSAPDQELWGASPSADVAGRDLTAAQELAEFDGRQQRHPQTKPGTPVTGRLMDNGPEDRRVYDHPEAFASPRPD